MDKIRHVLLDKNLLWLDRDFFKNTFDGDDDDDNDRGDDGDGDNKCEAERCASLVKKRKEHVYTLEGGTSRTKQKFRTAATKANEDVYF